jgi:hypothetical protein
MELHTAERRACARLPHCFGGAARLARSHASSTPDGRLGQHAEDELRL